MDSLQVFLQLPQAAKFWWEPVLDFIVGILPYAVALGVPWITFWHSRKLKEADFQNAEEDRQFQIEKTISEQAVRVMSHSYHLVHVINRSLGRYRNANDETKRAIEREVMEAREYWEENVFYLPHSIRKHVIPMTNLTYVSFQDTDDQGHQHAAFDRVLTMFRELESAFANLMKEYNLFDKFGSTVEPPTSHT